MTTRKQKVIAIVGIFVIALGVGLYSLFGPPDGRVLGQSTLVIPQTLWQYQCMDTMKYSRDAAREFMSNPQKADSFIANEISTIKSLGANCVAIGTPYDEEFVPILTKWVNAVHNASLAVWFRGNMSGWEGWFDYPKFISVAQHHAGITNLITKHPDLFADWDIFTPAPEAENGILGNPWRTFASREQLRQFVIASYDNCQSAFALINKKTQCGYFSANGDVAEQIYNADSVAKTGGTIVIDHYISDPARMGRDIVRIAQKQNAALVVGEFGAPIPDINGNMTETQQADFIRQLLQQFYINKKVVRGINYWVMRGGSTQLVNPDGTLRQATEAIKDYFQPAIVSGQVTDGVGQPLAGVTVKTGDGVQQMVTDASGSFGFALPAGQNDLMFYSPDYTPTTISIDAGRGAHQTVSASMDPNNPSLWYKIRSKLRN